MKPIYTHGGMFTGIEYNGWSVPLDPHNTTYDRVITELAAEGKTLEQWLAENPYIPWGDQSLAEHRLSHLLKLNKALNSAIQERYNQPEERVDQFKQLLNRARFKLTMNPTSIPLQEAVAYLESFEDWAMYGAQAIYAHSYAYVMAAQTHEEIEAVSWDLELSQWLEQDQHWEVMIAAYKLAQGEAA